MGLKSIFIRPLTPLGCANKDWNIVGYSAEEFNVEFYNKAFDYILQLNMNGTEISEGHATIFLSKILHGYPVNYMELRSPCGQQVSVRLPTITTVMYILVMREECLLKWETIPLNSVMYMTIHMMNL